MPFAGKDLKTGPNPFHSIREEFNIGNRFSVHKECVDGVIKILTATGSKFSVIGREELHRALIQDIDLVIGVGGDGTILNLSSFLDDSVPVLG